MNDAHLLRHAREIFASALRDCSVERAYDRKLQVVQRGGRRLLHVAGETQDLTEVRHLRIVSAGKAAGEMLTGFLSRVSIAPECEMRGVLIAHHPPEGLPDAIQFFAGGHPIPNQASFDGASAALNLMREAATMRDALCVFLLSGGASAMMELPLAPEISLADTAAFYQMLVHSGATIAEINCIRKHFSAVKGGRLALAAGDAATMTILVSDVPPQCLDSLASGPTVPDTTTVPKCRDLLRRYSLDRTLPHAIQTWFSSHALPETPKPGQFASRLSVLLDSGDLAASAGEYARALGYEVVLDHACDDWPYSQAASYLLDRIRTLRTQYARVCLLSAGEVTVAVSTALSPGTTHAGGRNQHLALYFATLLTQADDGIVLLSAGSDGIDGNSAAAGGVVGTHTLEAGRRWEEARRALDQFDSSTFLASCGAILMTGATGNNLRDLRVVLADQCLGAGQR